MIASTTENNLYFFDLEKGDRIKKIELEYDEITALSIIPNS